MHSQLKHAELSRNAVVHTETVLRMELFLQSVLRTEGDERFVSTESAISLVGVPAILLPPFELVV